MHKKIIASVAVLGLIAVTATLLWWQHQRPKQQSAASNPVPVRLIAAKTKNLPVTQQALGTIVAPETTKIKAQIAGQVESINFTNGQNVADQQLLVQLNDTKQRAALEQAEASLQRYQAQYKRFLRLEQQGHDFVTGSDFDTALSQYRSAQADIKTAKHDIDLMQIKAPFAGKMGVAQIAKGSFVNVGDNLATLVNVNNLEVAYSLPVEDYRYIKTDMQIHFSTDSYPGKTFSATVDYIAPEVDTNSMSFNLRAHIDAKQANGQLAPGMLAHVVQPLISNRPVTVVPAISLVPLVDGYAVYTVNNGKVGQRHVKLLGRQNQWALIESGLNPGDQVIATGNTKATVGRQVKVVQS